MSDHSQETVFVYKPAPPNSAPRNRLRDRLAHYQLDGTPQQEQLRIGRFLEVQELISTTNDALVAEHHRRSLAEFTAFVRQAEGSEKLPTVFMLKADAKSYTAKIKEQDPAWNVISIHSKECPNFKSTVKLIVNRFTSTANVLDRRLTYDFHVLKDSDLANQPLFIVLEDTEGFDAAVVRELISYMQTYASELKLHLLLNLHFPLALTEQNLNQSHIVGMDVHVIEGMPAATAFIDTLQERLSAVGITLDPGLLQRLSGMILPEVVSRVRYAVLAYFAGNPSNQLFNVPVTGEVLDHACCPNYRPLVEQALSDATIYVGNGVDRMSVPTSVLYQLSRESSIYINIYDFYCAFKEMVRRVPGCTDWDRQSMAIFLESISELKMMGVLRDCKRKFECVEKTSWKGV